MAGRRLVDHMMDDEDEDIDFDDYFGSDSELTGTRYKNFSKVHNKELHPEIFVGPPPLAREFIDAIPVTRVTQDQVNDKLQCTVCKQEFTFNESVKQLKCQHIYHENCIRPWLELHNTCPICRETLSPAGDRYNEAEGHRNRLTRFLNGQKYTIDSYKKFILITNQV